MKNLKLFCTYTNENRDVYVIPYHYGSIVGDISLGNDMKNILKDKCIVIIK